MERIFVVYKCDTHLSYYSRDIIGIATNTNEAVTICKAKARKEGNTFTKNDLWLLSEKWQTQDYKGEGNFQFEEMKVNKLI